MLRSHVMLAMVLLAGMGMQALAGSGNPIPDALRQQAAAGDAKAQVALGHALQADGVAADKPAAVDWYRKAAEQGSAEAAWMLSSAYMGGMGVPRDMSAAVEWMRKSVSIDGDPDHMSILAITLFTTGNLPEASQWAQKSADKGSTKGMTLLAMANITGEMGLPKDQAAGEHWLLLAAQKGDPEAQVALGQIYITGMLGRTDTAAGIRWLQSAADQGSARAAGTLGYFYITGKQNVPQDVQRGVELARKALAGNDMMGHFAMGVAYATGAGVAADPARGWYELATAQRMDNQHELKSAVDYMSRAATQLSPERLKELRAKVDADAAAAKATGSTG
ncbi:tetratricopeptide repeat protein [Dyella sp. RRB7]|uniref:tetratricopeptide repeat protein n=1 Tax=Dyella sp. RRB7 TaxID=2919502 RepID=UPI001FAB1EDB|nr:tetratricopeptide repeat protein [Dyella sp. RRB7]